MTTMGLYRLEKRPRGLLRGRLASAYHRAKAHNALTLRRCGAAQGRFCLTSLTNCFTFSFQRNHLDEKPGVMSPLRGSECHRHFTLILRMSGYTVATQPLRL